MNLRFIKFITFFSVFFTALFSHAQSTSQEFPTPATSNEIIGTIKARDVGDPRLTTYFYTFDGEQGDLFVNVVTRNFTGDVDVFLSNGLRSLAKIVVYSDLSENETGRVIYLRKPEKLMLRIQGRSPGDDPATFRIKFAGGFVAAKPTETSTEPELPQVAAANETGIRVNSVGTIIEIIPKPTPSPDAVAVAEMEEAKPKAAETEPKVAETAEIPAEKAPELVSIPQVIVTDNIPKAEKKVPRRNRRSRTKTPEKKQPESDPAETLTEENPAVAEPEAEPAAKASRKSRPPKAPKEKAPDPLENVRLVILFKDGKKIERPMSEVFKFSVDKGVLTVVSRGGSVGRYSIFDVAKVTIE